SVIDSLIVAGDLAYKVLGTIGSKFILLLVSLSTFGSANASTFGSSRLYLAAARQNQFLFANLIKQVNTRTNTPVNSLIAHCIWICTLIIIFNRLNTLVNYT